MATGARGLASLQYSANASLMRPIVVRETPRLPQPTRSRQALAKARPLQVGTERATFARNSGVTRLWRPASLARCNLCSAASARRLPCRAHFNWLRRRCSRFETKTAGRPRKRFARRRGAAGKASATRAPNAAKASPISGCSAANGSKSRCNMPNRKRRRGPRPGAMGQTRGAGTGAAERRARGAEGGSTTKRAKDERRAPRHNLAAKCLSAHKTPEVLRHESR